MTVGQARRWIAALVSVAVTACGGDVVSAGTESETRDSSSEIPSDDDGDTSESDGWTPADLGDSDDSDDGSKEPPPIPDSCTGSAYTLGSCVDETISELCDDHGLHIAVPICSDLVSGPRVLGFSSGLWACGCYSPYSMNARDLDGDGADELLVPCSDPSKLIIWKGRHDGKLSCGEAHATTGGSVWVRDLDEDGLDDIVMVGWWSGFVSLLRASAPGEFEPSVPLGSPGSLGSLRLGWADRIELDVDGDGRTELLGTSWAGEFGYGPVIVWSVEAGAVTVSTDLFDAPGPHRLHRADLDGDGWLDLIAAAEPSWWAAGSEAGLGAVVLLEDSSDLLYGSYGDVDGDGLADLVLGGNPPTVRFGIGDGSFGPSTSSPDPDAPEYAGGWAELVRDLDGDGRAELVLNAYGSGWSVWRSTADGPRFDVHADIYETTLFTSGDFDGDGRIDLVSSPPLAAETNGQITVWRAQP